MAEIQNETQLIYLHPGEFHLARNPSILRTVLGSCVGVTFWSPRLGIGALCHGVLPKSPHGLDAKQGYRYVDFAIRDIVRQFDRLGARRSEMQVKVFGGADVLPVHRHAKGKTTVGKQNWQTALEVLHDERLKVLASDLGGTAGRTIEFYTETGEVLLRRLSQKNGEPW
jgi:chemotaxis protein CheD